MGKFSSKVLRSRQHPYPELQSKAYNDLTFEFISLFFWASLRGFKCPNQDNMTCTQCHLYNELRLGYVWHGWLHFSMSSTTLGTFLTSRMSKTVCLLAVNSQPGSNLCATNSFLAPTVLNPPGTLEVFQRKPDPGHQDILPKGSCHQLLKAGFLRILNLCVSLVFHAHQRHETHVSCLAPSTGMVQEEVTNSAFSAGPFSSGLPLCLQVCLCLVEVFLGQAVAPIHCCR